MHLPNTKHIYCQVKSSFLTLETAIEETISPLGPVGSCLFVSMYVYMYFMNLIGRRSLASCYEIFGFYLS